MLLIAVLIVTGAVVILMIAVKCTFFYAQVGSEKACQIEPWGQLIQDFILDAMPILIALVMRNPPPNNKD